LPVRHPRLPRLTDSRPLGRAIAHLAVAGLVAFTAAFGFSAVQGSQTAQGGQAAQDGRIPQPGLAAFVVSTARGASVTRSYRSASFLLNASLTQPDPFVDDTRIPTQNDFLAPTPTPTPKPTPKPKPPVYVAVKSNGSLLWPVPGAVITQYFWSGHLAVDLAAPAGSPVLAAADGVVIWAGWRNDGGGLVVEIDHGNGLHTVYNHLGLILVKKGDTATRGERIANVGCTGDCTGPHVHFAVKVNGVYVNPLRYISR